MAANWTFSPSEFGAVTEAAAERVTREIVLTLIGELTVHNPVDTGRSKGNWFTTIEQPHRGYSWNRYSPGGELTRRNAEVTMNRFTLGNTIWIANNLPYIEFLEYGTPRMRPFAMLQKSVAATRQRLR